MIEFAHLQQIWQSSYGQLLYPFPKEHWFLGKIIVTGTSLQQENNYGTSKKRGQLMDQMVECVLPI